MQPQVVNHYPNHYELTRKALQQLIMQSNYKLPKLNASLNPETLNSTSETPLKRAIKVEFETGSSTAFLVAQYLGGFWQEDQALIYRETTTTRRCVCTYACHPVWRHACMHACMQSKQKYQ